jgi:hypothetical protein
MCEQDGIGAGAGGDNYWIIKDLVYWFKVWTEFWGLESYSAEDTGLLWLQYGA